MRHVTARSVRTIARAEATKGVGPVLVTTVTAGKSEKEIVTVMMKDHPIGMEVHAEACPGPPGDTVTIVEEAAAEVAGTVVIGLEGARSVGDLGCRSVGTGLVCLGISSWPRSWVRARVCLVGDALEPHGSSFCTLEPHGS